MVITTVVHCKKEPYDFYGGRPSFLGNPYEIGDFYEGIQITRQLAITLFESYFKERIELDFDFRSKVLALKDKILSCWCKPLPCHLDIVAEWLNNYGNNNSTTT